MEKVLVLNNTLGIASVHIPSPNVHPDQRKLLMLMPGYNFVDAADLLECRKNPMFAAKFEREIERQVADEARGLRVGQMELVLCEKWAAKEPLAALGIDRAKEVIGDVSSEEDLHALRSTNSDPEIDRALKERIESIENPVENHIVRRA